MTEFLPLFLSGVISAAVALGIAHWCARKPSGVNGLLRRTLVVHTKDGKSFRGVLVGEYVDCLVLEQAELLDEKVTIGGQAVLLRVNVSWAQDVTAIVRPDASTAPSEVFEVSRDEVK